MAHLGELLASVPTWVYCLLIALVAYKLGHAVGVARAASVTWGLARELAPELPPFARVWRVVKLSSAGETDLAYDLLTAPQTPAEKAARP